MAYTLADYARLSTDPLKSGVIDIFRRESFILDRLSFENAGALHIKVIRNKSLPSVSWRKIGETWTHSQGSVETIEERAYVCGGLIDVDKVLVRAKNTVTDQRALQTDMFLTAVSYEFNDKFVNGSPTVDEDAIVGIRYRLVKDLPASQSLDGAGVDISPDAASLSTNIDTFLDKLDELIDRCAGHTADMLVMNSTAKLRLQSALRQKGYLAQDKDQYGRKITRYGEGGPEIVDLGVKADQITKIIGDVELQDGSAITGGACTSVYALKFGQEKYLCGFEEYPMDVVDKGLLEDGVTYRTVVDWVNGIYMVDPFSIARLHGVVAA